MNSEQCIAIEESIDRPVEIWGRYMDGSVELAGTREGKSIGII